MKLVAVASVVLILSGFALSRAESPATQPTTAPAESLFAPTPAIDLAGHHGFADTSSLNDDAATQLKGLCTLAEFQALPEADRHVYAFDPWPGTTDDLGKKSYTFNFHLGDGGVSSEKIAFIPSGGGPNSGHNVVRKNDADTAKPTLTGFANLDWSGIQEHVFKFDKPVIAFGVVLKSSGDIDLRRFYWQAAVERNGYPVSYTLADGTVVQLGQRDLRGATIKAGASNFVGVIDHSGRGITSVTYTIKGLAGNKAQSVCLCDVAFVTLPKPAVATVINLRSSCDFDAPDAITASPTSPAGGLATLDAFRAIVGNHRYVYHFDTWPTSDPDNGPKAAVAPSNTAAFDFDLKGSGEIGQRVAIQAASSVGNLKLIHAELKDNESLPYHALGGLGDLGNAGWATQTIRFRRPVWAVGVTYRSPADANLTGDAKTSPVSYTLSDGTVVNVGAAGGSAGTIAGNTKTFVGVIDDTDKGISSVTIRVQGTASAAQPVYIEDLAFALAGPPPGDWKLTLNDGFDGDQLDPKNWSTGYKFVDVINSELQGFVPENVVVADGLCTIKTEHRDCRNTDRFGNLGKAQHFASGAFTSVDKFTQTYGYFEARLKMPRARGAGVWPAFWMLPDRGRDYPDSSRYGYMSQQYGRGMEIDIFEFMPRWKQLDGLFPVHMGCIWSYGKATEKDPAPHGYGGFAQGNDGWGPQELDLPNLDGEFHTYGIYWSPQRLIWFIDSKPVYRVKDAAHVPDVPHYFLFNISVHPNGWGKSPDKKNPTMDDIIADQPNQMQIDYFRAYSGTLEEDVPAAADDIPGPVTKYSPPSKDQVATPAAAPTTAPAEAPKPSPKDVPAAPANSHITTPSSG